MTDQDNLVPPPPIVRDRLARNIRERRLLRALLRLSIRAVEDQRQERPYEARETERGGL